MIAPMPAQRPGRDESAVETCAEAGGRLLGAASDRRSPGILMSR